MEFKEKSNLLNLKNLTSPNNHIKSKVMYPKAIFLILFPLFAFSQSPQKINFQSILRNTNGEIVANKSVSLKISILSGSINGSSVYAETHTKTTDASGLISLQIGNGTVLSGIFANIGWGNASHFIKLEADFNGGNNYVLLGTQELMSVPYALYASKATNTSGIDGIYSWEYPEGLSKDVVIITQDPFVVPNGKTLYLLKNERAAIIDGVSYTSSGGDTRIFKEGTILSGATPERPFNGFLTLSSNRITPCHFPLSNELTFNVPSNKILVLISGQSPICKFNLGEVPSCNLIKNLGFFLIPESSIIYHPDTISRGYTGYLIDK